MKYQDTVTQRNKIIR